MSDQNFPLKDCEDYPTGHTHTHTHTSGECARLACSEEIAAGPAVPTSQQDLSFQFPAAVSISASLHAGNCEVGLA